MIDSHMRAAITNFLHQEGENNLPDPLILLKVDLKSNIDKLMKEFPNLQHFCIRDIPDERTKGIIVRGTSLEETQEYDKFVKDSDTSGSINYIGITSEFGKLIYLGTDGSAYSRMNFLGEEKYRIIYELYSRLKKINAFTIPLDQFNY